MSRLVGGSFCILIVVICHQVIVKDGENNSFEFTCNRWLSESEDDGQISRDLVLADGGEDFTPGKSL